MMTILASLLLIALVVQHVLHKRQVDAILERQEKSQASLMDRIQHPEIRQVEAGAIVEHDTPTDGQEMAYVGQIVPEFVKVGMTDGD